MWYIGPENDAAVGAGGTVDRVVDWHVLVLGFTGSSSIAVAYVTKFFSYFNNW